MRKLFINILFVFLFQTINAQIKNTIQGVITDNHKNPIENVTISIKNTTLKTTTDANGEFILKTNLDKLNLTVSNEGFEEQEIDISFKESPIITIQIQLNDDTHRLEEVVINANQSLMENSISKAKERQKAIPGGTNIVSMNELTTQRLLTLKDALQLQPGIMIQEFFGSNDQPRLNIRGSGIQSNPQRKGINLLQDGITTNFSDGSYIIGILEPRAANYIEVFKGANSLKYGSATLGGAMNLVSKNGYNASPLEVKFESGGFDYYGGSISSGLVFGKNDLFASVSLNDSEGYRDHNTSNRFNATLNYGRKFNDKFESRLYFTYTNLKFDVPGPLTQEQLDEDPKQINPGITPPISIGPNVIRDEPRRFSDILRIANKSVYRFSKNTSVNFGLRYQYADDTFVFPIADGIWRSLNNDFGVNAFFNTKTQKNNLSIGLDVGTGTIDRAYYINLNGERGGLFAHNEFTSTNIVFFAEDIYKFNPKLSGIASIQLSSNTRNNDDVYNDPTRPFYNQMNQSYGTVESSDSSLDQDFFGFNPRIGLIYNLTKNNQLFFNLSRSYEPPTFDELINLSGGNPNLSPNTIEAVELDEQTATTFELGTRGRFDRFIWDLSLYHSIVKDEILTTADVFGTSGMTRNSPDQTIHQGIELGLGLTLFKNIFSKKGDQLSFKGVYNYSNFYFNEGIYENNQIAGIPKHYINSALEYQSAYGLFVNINSEWLPEDTPIDHQNTVYQQDYLLFGFRFGFNKDKWSVFIDGKNITDEKYASSYLIRDLVTAPNLTTFIPGTGVNFTIGINYKL